MEQQHVVKMENGNSKTLPEMLGCIERYNPGHLEVLEQYLEEQSDLGSYNLEANLAILKLYQFNPQLAKLNITIKILLKALANLPHADFVLAKCLLIPSQVKEEKIKELFYLADILEKCEFALFWQRVDQNPENYLEINGFFDSIRKFICHVIGGTYQTIKTDSLKLLLGGVEEKTLDMWMKKYGWKHQGDLVFIAAQDENIKTKNISEKIEFDNLAPLVAQCL